MLERGIHRCKKCPNLISVTNGTAFDSGKKSLRLLFYVIWLLMVQKTGIGAKNFQDTFGFGSYQATWGWPQKLRCVIIRKGRDLLSGRVEVDETYIGGRGGRDARSGCRL